MSLGADALRDFFPRLMELMLQTPSPVLDFGGAGTMASKSGELAATLSGPKCWPPTRCRLVTSPIARRHSTFWPGAANRITGYLDSLLSGDGVPAARHLANVIDAVFATREPFESASKTTVLDWLTNPAVGLRSERACFAANSPEAARQLSAAYELWTVCARKVTVRSLRQGQPQTQSVQSC